MTTRCTRLPSCAVWASCGLGLVQLQWEGILVTLGIKAVAERVVYAGWPVPTPPHRDAFRERGTRHRLVTGQMPAAKRPPAQSHVRASPGW